VQQAVRNPGRGRTFLICVLLAAGAFALYAYRLGDSPVHLAIDEVMIALNAESIASTGHDWNGRLLPLYIQVSGLSWFEPLIIYSLALVFKVLPVSEFTIRLPTVCVGVANIVLIYLVARVLVKRDAPAVMASFLLALTPAHFLHSRFGMDFIYPLPFILLWLLCLFTYFESASRRVLFAGTVCLGLGFYSYISSVLLMPMYLAITCLMLASRRAPVRDYVAAAGGFALPLLLFVPWALLHPDAYVTTVKRYALYDTRQMNALQGIRAFFGYTNIASKLSLYWEYFDPSFLFLDASAPEMFTTRHSGVFLAPCALFMAIGGVHAIRSSERSQWVTLLGFATAPAAAVLVVERGSIHRALAILPFGILLATIGVTYLWTTARLESRRTLCLIAAAAGLSAGLARIGWALLTHSHVGDSALPLIVLSAGVGVIGLLSERGAWRTVVVLLLLVTSVQFRTYAADYFTGYRRRSSLTFGGNVHGAFDYVVDRERTGHVPAIYMRSGLMGPWRLFLKMRGREDLLNSTMYFGPPVNVGSGGGRSVGVNLDVTTMPEGSLVVALLDDRETAALVEAGGLTQAAAINEPNGQPYFAVFQR
jgi:4-amino-4-deoxy-L-arabinose transferase-like glycosyltransferase